MDRERGIRGGKAHRAIRSTRASGHIMKILARHNRWVSGCTITESHCEEKSPHDGAYRRFTATIRGFQNWKIFEGVIKGGTDEKVASKVREIRDRIDSGDETVFEHKGFWL